MTPREIEMAKQAADPTLLQDIERAEAQWLAPKTTADAPRQTLDASSSKPDTERST